MSSKMSLSTTLSFSNVAIQDPVVAVSRCLVNISGFIREHENVWR